MHAAMKNTTHTAASPDRISPDRVLLLTGLFLLIMELWKQLYLYTVLFHGRYNVWYLPFQLCSMPLYLCPLYAYAKPRRKKADPAHFAEAPAGTVAGTFPEAKPAFSPRLALRPAIAAFLQDFGLLGGIAALAVPDGFLHPGHPLLSLHGYVWHLTLIALSLYIRKKHLAPSGLSGFLPALPLYGCAALLAELLNVLLHPFGDCDMFYISPYHNSVQPVFSTIDRIVDRPLGIVIYLAAAAAGALCIHLLYALKVSCIFPQKRPQKRADPPDHKRAQ